MKKIFVILVVGLLIMGTSALISVSESLSTGHAEFEGNGTMEDSSNGNPTPCGGDGGGGSGGGGIPG